jgi:type III secretion protein U
MSEKPSGEKTEEPTPKRLEESRKQGQVIRSADIVTTVASIAVMWTVYLSLSTMIKSASVFLEKCLKFAGESDPSAMQEILRDGTSLFLHLVLPIAAASIAAVFFGNVLQFGFIFASKAIEPNISKLNPAEGLKKIFSLKNLLEFCKSSIKVTLIAVLLIWVVRQSLDPLSKLPAVGINAAIRVSLQMFSGLVILLMLAYAVIAAGDYFLQRMLTMKELRMTKDEVKRENKEMEGDPQIKANRRRLFQEFMLADNATAVRKSTVLVTNPTHYAAAIYYERGVTELPVLLAKGKGFAALHMMRIAREENVPIVQNVPLAQDLNRRCEPNSTVPDDLLEAVADILRWVQSLPPRNAVG